LRTYSIDHIFIESNGVGLAAVLQMKEKMKGATKLTTLTASENKEVRILGSYEFIQKYFIFDSNYKDRAQYNQFMKDLTSYIAGGDNKHRKDAIDVLCTAAELLKIKFSKFVY